MANQPHNTISKNDEQVQPVHDAIGILGDVAKELEWYLQHKASSEQAATVQEPLKSKNKDRGDQRADQTDNYKVYQRYARAVGAYHGNESLGDVDDTALYFELEDARHDLMMLPAKFPWLLVEKFKILESELALSLDSGGRIDKRELLWLAAIRIDCVNLGMMD